jgi:hypothetical protein
MPIPSGTYESLVFNNDDSKPKSIQVRVDGMPFRDATQGHVSGEVYHASTCDPNATYNYFLATSITRSENLDTLSLELDYYFPSTGNSRATAGTGSLVITTLPSGDYHAVLVMTLTSEPPIPQRYGFTLSHRGFQLRQAECVPCLLYPTDIRAEVQPNLDDTSSNFDTARIQLTFSPLIWRKHGQVEWDEGDLNGFMNQSDVFFRSEAEKVRRAWRMLLLVAPKFRESATTPGTTTGIMFDSRATAPRKGAAAFWDAYANLPDADRSSHFTRTVTHELGHCFNLLHTFDDHSDLSSGQFSYSYMNYPSRFLPDGDAGYWRKESRDFDEYEKRSIWHGNLKKVVMGGGPLGEGFLYGPDVDDFEPETCNGNLALMLRRGKEYNTKTRKWEIRTPQHEFGEPVRLQAKLQNMSRNEQEVEDTLQPTHRQTEYRIRLPSGRFIRFRPRLLRCSGAGSRSALLFPDHAGPEHRSSLFDEIHLSYGAGGLYFQEPGRYQVQAIHRGPDGVPIASNVVDIWVRYPDEVTEDLVVPTMREDILAYLSGWGTRALAEAETTLNTFLEENRRRRPAKRPHPLANEIVRCKAYARFGPNAILERGPDGRPQVRSEEAKCAEAATMLESHFGDSAARLATLPLDNILFIHLLGQWNRALDHLDPAKPATLNMRQQIGEALRIRMEKEQFPPFLRTELCERWSIQKPEPAKRSRKPRSSPRKPPSPPGPGTPPASEGGGS